MNLVFYLNPVVVKDGLSGCRSTFSYPYSDGADHVGFVQSSPVMTLQ
jgi:hypothetical protein